MNREPRKTKREKRADTFTTRVDQRRLLPRLSPQEIRQHADPEVQAIELILRAVPDLPTREAAAAAYGMSSVARDLKKTPAAFTDLLITAYRAGAPAASALLGRFIPAIAADVAWEESA